MVLLCCIRLCVFRTVPGIIIIELGFFSCCGFLNFLNKDGNRILMNGDKFSTNRASKTATACLLAQIHTNSLPFYEPNRGSSVHFERIMITRSKQKQRGKYLSRKVIKDRLALQWVVRVLFTRE